MLMLGQICLQIINKTKKQNKITLRKKDDETTVCECKKLRNLITTVVGIKIAIISKQEYYNVRIEYGESINESVTPKGDDAVDDVCNVYNSKKVPNINEGKLTNSIISDDKRKYMTSRKASRKLKGKILEKGKYSVSLKVSNEKNTKNLRFIWLKTNQYIVLKTEQEQLPKHSEDGQNKYLKRTFIQINAFLLQLVIQFVGSQL